MTTFDSLKLLDNAKTSIKLGVADFNLSQKSVAQGGDPGRTFSAVRNLFAGVLLLFKYRIATKVKGGELLISTSSIGPLWTSSIRSWPASGLARSAAFAGL